MNILEQIRKNGLSWPHKQLGDKSTEAYIDYDLAAGIQPLFRTGNEFVLNVLSCDIH
jgi:hypothetical protein